MRELASAKTATVFSFVTLMVGTAVCVNLGCSRKDSMGGAGRIDGGPDGSATTGGAGGNADVGGETATSAAGAAGTATETTATTGAGGTAGTGTQTTASAGAGGTATTAGSTAGTAGTSGTGPFDAAVPTDTPVPSAPDARPDTPMISEPLPVDARPLACSALRGLDKRVLTSQRSKAVLFSGDGRSLVLRVQAKGDAGQGDDVVVVELPEGKVRPLAEGVGNVEWLGDRALLLTMAGTSDLVAARLDGAERFTVASATCDHAATPDGTRVYAKTDCEGAMPVSVFDVSSRTSRVVSKDSVGRGIAVAPGGAWAAFVVDTPEGKAEAFLSGEKHYVGVVTVVDATGKSYEISSVSSASVPVFLSDQVLIFRTDSSYPWFKFYSHAPGTGDTSRFVVEGFPGFQGYQVTPDGKGIVMGATRQTLLWAALDGTSSTLLASDLFNFTSFEFSTNFFVISRPTGRVVYYGPRNAGSKAYFASVTLAGDQRVVFGDGLGSSLAVSPYADRVASGNKVVSASTGAEAFSFRSDRWVECPTFVPGDRGLVFVDRALTADAGPIQFQLSHLSFSTGQSAALGQWNDNQMAPNPNFYWGMKPAGYAMDPSGCYVVFDSDLSEPGTRLAVLPD